MRNPKPIIIQVFFCFSLSSCQLPRFCFCVFISPPFFEKNCAFIFLRIFRFYPSKKGRIGLYSQMIAMARRTPPIGGKHPPPTQSPPLALESIRLFVVPFSITFLIKLVYIIAHLYLKSQMKTRCILGTSGFHVDVSVKISIQMRF